jgi:hypothetical protein
VNLTASFARGGSAFFRWVLAEGSTRPLALMRVLAVIVLWAKWGRLGALPARAMDVPSTGLSVLFFAFTILMFVGYRTRLFTALTAALVLYGYHGLGVIGGARGTWVHHHTDLLKFFVVLLALTPCGRSLSVDRWLELRRAAAEGRRARPEWGPLWGQRLIALQLVAMYAWAGIAKLEWAFLSGARMEAYLTEFYFGAEVPVAPWFHAICFALGTGTVLLEFALALAMVWPRIQRWVLPFGVVLHVSFYMMFPVATFSVTVLAMYLAAIPPERVDQVIRGLVLGISDSGSTGVNVEPSYSAQSPDGQVPSMQSSSLSH